MLIIPQQIDWRYSWLVDIFKGVNTSIEEIWNRHQESETDPSAPPFDGFDATEHWEACLGISFVAAQTYISGVVSDFRKISLAKNILLPCAKNDLKRKLLKKYGRFIPNTQFTDVQICDAVANYFKHHEEWDAWQENGWNKDTLRVLATLGVNGSSEFPCCDVAEQLAAGKLQNLDWLLDILSHWRKRVVDPISLG